MVLGAHGHVRDIIGDEFGQFPDDKTTVGSDPCKSVAVNGHINDLGYWRKDGRQLEKGAITAGT